MIPAFLGLGFLGANSASAHGMGMFGGFGGMWGSAATPDEIAARQQAMFQSEASLLGISVDDVKAAWAAGKSLPELAQEKGITMLQLQQKLKDAQTAKIKTQLKALVDKGIISQAQADQRLQFMQNQQAQINGKLGSRRGLGKGMMRGLGW